MELWDDSSDPNIGDEGRMRPESTLDEVFSAPDQGVVPFETAHPDLAGYGSTTMIEALRFADGGGLDGATRTLLRTATASFLNAGYEGLEFPYRRYVTGENGNPSLAAQVSDALASGDPMVVLDVAAALARANDLTCPL